MPMPIPPLTPEQLRRRCDPAQFGFATTAELGAGPEILGQARATDAIASSSNAARSGSAPAEGSTARWSSARTAAGWSPRVYAIPRPPPMSMIRRSSPPTDRAKSATIAAAAR